MISVLLPYRDAAPTMREALASILADMAEDDELVAIDDGSTDGTARIVHEHAARDRRIVEVRSVGTGIARALATGAEASRGDLLARMDADDVSLPGRLAASRALLESDASLGAVGTQVEAFVSIEGLAGARPSEGIDRYVAWQNAILTKEDHAHAIYVESPLCHPSVTMRRSALVAAGGFRDPPWPEDWDLWLRMHDSGFDLAKVPRVLLRWRRHAGTTTATDPRCSPERLRDARATYLAKDLAREGRPFAIWGAGQTGRRLARALEAHGARACLFIDIDPRKQKARELPVLAPVEGLARVRRDAARVVVAVGTPGARDVVRARLATAGLREGSDFVCAA